MDQGQAERKANEMYRMLKGILDKAEAFFTPGKEEGGSPMRTLEILGAEVTKIRAELNKRDLESWRPL
jgi:hypothetical protein